MVHICLLDLFGFYESKAPFPLLFLFFFIIIYTNIHLLHLLSAFLSWFGLVKIFCSNLVILSSISMMQFLQKLGYGKKLYIENSFENLKCFRIQNDSVKDELIRSYINLASLYALYSLRSQNSAQAFVDLEQLCIMTIIFPLLSCALP